MKTFNVVIPIAGHAYVEVEAEDEEAAIEKAMEEVSREDIEDWENLHQFNRGNICYCPKPWEITVKEIATEDEA